MVEKQKNEPENGKMRNCVVSCLCGAAPFVAGLVVALAFGWLVFPDLMFTKKEQPIAFNHQAMLVKANMACSDCHSLRDDGSFTGIPTIAVCATCHANPIGDTENEKRFVEEYVRQGKEVPWLAYQKQPDNVYFSHAAHSIASCNSCHDFTPRELCNLCHIDMAATTSAPPMYKNWMTGYSKSTMTMDACERCHAHPEHLGVTNANNACFVCHK